MLPSAHSIFCKHEASENIGGSSHSTVTLLSNKTETKLNSIKLNKLSLFFSHGLINIFRFVSNPIAHKNNLNNQEKIYMLNKGPPFLKKLFCFSVRNERICRALVIFFSVFNFFNYQCIKKKKKQQKK